LRVNCKLSTFMTGAGTSNQKEPASARRLGKLLLYHEIPEHADVLTGFSGGVSVDESGPPLPMQRSAPACGLYDREVFHYYPLNSTPRARSSRLACNVSGNLSICKLSRGLVPNNGDRREL
jgi:hypothetical protein